MAELPAMKFGDQPTRARATVVLSSDRNGFFSSSIATVTSRTPGSVPLNNHSQISTIVYRMLSVSSTTDSGPGSLRAGIDEANARCLGDVPCKMTFDVPEYSTIEPLTPLPAIRAGWLRIDGNRLRDGDRRVELSGDRLTDGSGLEIHSDRDPSHPLSLEIFGLAINRFPDYGVATTGSGDANVRLDGLFVGTDVTGTLARPNGRGYGLFAPRMGISIGQNVISGNVHSGIFDWSALNLWLSNSLIGVGADHRALGNGNSGVFEFRGSMDIGGCTIANNGQFGVSIAPEVARASIAGTGIFSNGVLGIDWGLDGPSSGLAVRRIPDPPTITDATYDAEKNETVIRGTIARDTQGRAEGERVVMRVVPSALDFTARAKGDLRGQIMTATLNIRPYLDSVPILTSEFSEGVLAH